MVVKISYHSKQRISEIFDELDATESEKFRLCLEYCYDKRFVEDTAVHLITIGRHLGPTNRDYYSRLAQNGNQIWAIIRENKIVTIMRRRENQPSTADAMRVAQIIVCKTD